MITKKLYKARSITGAEQRVRQLEKIVEDYQRICDRFEHERLMLAKLAATGPAFMNPLSIVAATRLRDELLRREGLNPDGSFR